MKSTPFLVFLLLLSLLSACNGPGESGNNAARRQQLCGGTCSGTGVGSFSFAGECTDEGIAANQEEIENARKRARQEAKNDASIKCFQRGGGNCICSGGEMFETEFTTEEYGVVVDLDLEAETTSVECLVDITYEYNGGSCSNWEVSGEGTAACGGLVTRSSMSRGGEYGICPDPCNEQIMEEVRERAREGARRAVNNMCASIVGDICQAVGGRELNIGERCINDPDVPEDERPECDYLSHQAILRAHCVFAP